jgi:hypothetical protein
VDESFSGFWAIALNACIGVSVIWTSIFSLACGLKSNIIVPKFFWAIRVLETTLDWVQCQ